jgi:hypothetical protein
MCMCMCTCEIGQLFSCGGQCMKMHHMYVCTWTIRHLCISCLYAYACIYIDLFVNTYIWTYTKQVPLALGQGSQDRAGNVLRAASCECVYARTRRSMCTYVYVVLVLYVCLNSRASVIKRFLRVFSKRACIALSTTCTTTRMQQVTCKKHLHLSSTWHTRNNQPWPSGMMDACVACTKDMRSSTRHPKKNNAQAHTQMHSQSSQLLFLKHQKN